jgi:FlaA1/EpsC-like NDP-sugar epimerase
MLGMGTDRQRFAGLVFSVIDCALIVTAILLATLFRFSVGLSFFLTTSYSISKIAVVVVVIQLSFYYFDLYVPTNYTFRKKMFILFMASLTASAVFMVLVYYLIPDLVIGRGVFFVTLILVFVYCFLARLLYPSLFRLGSFRERVLIMGTGALAVKIEAELTNNHGYQDFEIVGFVDEDGKPIDQYI